ncbi:polyadenylate-binding protein 4-like [Protopterus annectens]|uniref:polyadenylate-binding protein 4-like n=1 Tax=Protopterus annectens TaxID=7888 RepID=UPI001CF9D47F|nr:polyadenylate-binding protein 4-like [Protopterus annectens]XP_043942155.1 polyadenylate-binding protein 4-like [Protopterus annectens]
MNSSVQLMPTMASLYVDNLAPSVTEGMLYEKFSPFGRIHSIRMLSSFGYAFVNFEQIADAQNALDTVNFDVIKGKPMHVIWAWADLSQNKSGQENIIIKNLDRSIGRSGLLEAFSEFGNILRCKVAYDEKELKSEGFVQFENQCEAERAIQEMNGTVLSGCKLYVGPFRRSTLHDELELKAKNIYVKNFGEDMDDEKLQLLFDKYGPTVSVKVMRDQDGKSKGFGFVSFERPEDAQNAIACMNGKKINGKELYVSRAQNKMERQRQLALEFEQKKQERMTKGVNLYVNNLHPSIDNERLKEEFSPFGTITSAAVMREGSRSKGFGFVCFSSPQEATKAVTEMNGKLVNNKPLYVSLAQHKEERQAHLTAHYMHRTAANNFISNPFINPYKRMLLDRYFLSNLLRNSQGSQEEHLQTKALWKMQGTKPVPLQNINGAIYLPAPCLPTFTVTMPVSVQVPVVPCHRADAAVTQATRSQSGTDAAGIRTAPQGTCASDAEKNAATSSSENQKNVDASGEGNERCVLAISSEDQKADEDKSEDKC